MVSPNADKASCRQEQYRPMHDSPRKARLSEIRLVHAQRLPYRTERLFLAHFLERGLHVLRQEQIVGNPGDLLGVAPRRLE